jgi:hypothetical protein
MLAMISVSILTLLLLVPPVDPRKAEVERLTKDYNRAWSDFLSSLSITNNPIILNKKHDAIGLALKKLRNAVEATPSELVSDKAWTIANSGL